MATDSSHRVIMGKMVLPLLSAFLSDHFILAGKEDRNKSSEELEVRPDRTT